MEELDVKAKQYTPQLFLESEDKTDEARSTFNELQECTYSSKSTGSSGQHEHMTCDCYEDWDSDKQQNMACGEDSDCINRVTSVECSNKFCTCGNDCQNQRFQKKQYANVTVIQTELKGYGLRANEDISESSFIYEYIGEVIDEESFRKRMIDYDTKKLIHFYFMMLKKDSFIDATMKGSLARFCNHSCNPNAYVDKWVVGEKLRMGIFSKRNIQKGEEITFDYNVDRYGAQSQPCYCGEPNCIKWMGGKTQTDAALLLPDGISEALGVTHKQERQWLKENKHLRSKQQSDESIINEAFVKSIEVSALTESDVSKVMGALMRVQDLNITQKLIERIYLTSDDSINSSIIRVHGYKTLSQTIKAFKDEDKELISKILIILAKWPKVTRNKISSSQIEDVVKDINTNSNDDNLKKLSSDLLAEWGKLQMAYRIPKNIGNDKESNSPALYGRNARSRSRSRSPDRGKSAEPQHVETDEALPDGWQTAFDPNTQTNYYYHAELGISKWERPIKEVPKGPKGPKALPVSEPIQRPNLNSNGRSYNEEELTRREEERLKREKEEQFKEIQQKERLLQELILQSQKELEEKKSFEEKMKLEKLEKEKERQALKRKKLKKSKSSIPPAPPVPIEGQWTKTFAKHVPNFLKKYEAEIGRDNIKGCAKELVKTLVAKEMKKNPDTKPPKELDNAKLKKIKEYSKMFMDKFLIKYRSKHDKKRSHNEENGGTKRVKPDVE